MWHGGQRATLVAGWAITECSGRILDQALAGRLARGVGTHARLILPNGSTSQEVHLADTSAWITLAAALGGVALTGTLSLATAALTHRWTRQARLQADRENEARTIRDQRREAYHNYLVATNSFYQAVDQVYLKTGRKEQFDQHEHVRSAITALQDAYVYLTISAGSDVRKTAREYNVTLYDLQRAARGADNNSWPDLEHETHEARKRLREAMRAELGIHD